MSRAVWVYALLCLGGIAHAATAPTIVSTPSGVPGPGLAVVGSPYHYNDLDKAVAVGDAPITWSASGAPTGFTIDANTGAISWTPTMGGDFSFTIQASNLVGTSPPQTISVHVAAPAAITSQPTTTASVGQPYVYGSDGSVRASGDAPLTFSVVSGPPGFVVDAATGHVTWTPNVAGPAAVVVRADNAYGGGTQSFTVTVGGAGTAPTLAHDANPDGAVGVPYVYGTSRAISVTAGDAPVSFSKVAGPPELFVDAHSGVVAWIPAQAGMQMITVRASNLAGSDDYTFTVNVADGVTAMPTAVPAVSPATGDAPVTVTFSSAGSDPGAGSMLIDTEWEFGDGSPPSHDPAPMHTYLLAGVYTARLTVVNSFGASDTQPVVVSATANGVVPPRAHAVASSVEGTDLLMVQFTCDCAAGSNAIAGVRWDFGDGSQSNANGPMHTFLPGSYRVRLTVTDSVGLSSDDALLIIVKQGTRLPPLVNAYAAPPSGPAPLSVSLLATAIDLEGNITDLRWDFGDGTGASAVDHIQKTFDQPGTYQITLVAVGDSGLQAHDSLTITVGSSDQLPPQILSVPAAVAFVGVPYKYADNGLPLARGSRPLTWSLGGTPPAGMQVHSQTGEIVWTPTADEVGPVQVVLTASNGAASNSQTFTVDVRPASEAPHSGCALSPGASPDGLALVVVYLLVAFGVRRRRA
jgi:PKD repeat protein